MEIEYTNFSVDTSIYGENTVSGVIDLSGEFIYNNFYDTSKITYIPSLSVNLFLGLWLPTKKASLKKSFLEDLEYRSSDYSKKLNQLSSSELIKVLFAKLAFSSCKTIILKNIDIYLNYRELNQFLKVIKEHLVSIEKNIFFETTNINNIITQCDNYIIAKSGEIAYIGKDLKKLPLKTDNMVFADIANKKGAKIDYYKDSSDLLKAIYRNIKK